MISICIQKSCEWQSSLGINNTLAPRNRLIIMRQKQWQESRASRKLCTEIKGEMRHTEMGTPEATPAKGRWVKRGPAYATAYKCAS